MFRIQNIGTYKIYIIKYKAVRKNKDEFKAHMFNSDTFTGVAFDMPPALQGCNTNVERWGENVESRRLTGV